LLNKEEDVSGNFTLRFWINPSPSFIAFDNVQIFWRLG